MLEQSPDIVPPALGLPEAQADLVAMDRLRPVLSRLQRLTERVSDSEMALGSDLMNTALEGYGLLKVSGRNRGLEGAAEALGARFARRGPVRMPPRPSDASCLGAGWARSVQRISCKVLFLRSFCRPVVRNSRRPVRIGSAADRICR